MRNRQVLYVVIGGLFCAMVLAGLLVRHAWPLWTGKTIYLRVRPVDPHDMFRGDYFIVNCDISQLQVYAEIPPADALKGDPNQPWLRQGPAVKALGEWATYVKQGANHYEYAYSLRDRVAYVQLEPRPSDAADESSAEAASGAMRDYAAVSISDQPVNGRLNIRGLVRYTYGINGDRQVVGLSVQMHYGIDALYVQEGRGAEIQDAMRGQHVTLAEVAVTDGGQARLKNLLIDGKRVVPE